MSKYWEGPEMTPNFSRPFKNWQTDISGVPDDGSYFLGRITGTNIHKAVHWLDGAFRTPDGTAVSICQWITFSDFADLRACAWRQM